MPAWKVDINVNAKQPPRASFSPNTLQAQVGDLISWANNDNEQSHWPAPIGANGKPNETGWLSEAIPPNASSKQSLSPSAPGTLNYCCVLHQAETGVIQVSNQTVIINPAQHPTPSAPASFSPTPLSVAVGDGIQWVNTDSNSHQPMPSGGSATAWFSAPIQPGQGGGSQKPTAAAGTVNYGCALHSGESGVIKVS